MNKLYDKDECSPDAFSAAHILSKKEGKLVLLKNVEHEFNQDSTEYYFAPNSNQFYKIEYSCGVYETLYEITAQELQVELVGN